MIITPGYWRTRDGTRVTVLVTNAPGREPVIGYFEHHGKTIAREWGLDGRYSRDTHTQLDKDLIAPWEEEPACSCGSITITGTTATCGKCGRTIGERAEPKKVKRWRWAYRERNNHGWSSSVDFYTEEDAEKQLGSRLMAKIPGTEIECDE